MLIVLCFSYGELIFGLFIKNGQSFDLKLFEMHKNDGIMLSNMALVVLLFVDKFIHQLIIKRPFHFRLIDIMLFVCILVATLLTVFARNVASISEFENWFKLSYLFIAFILFLTVYKAEAMKISRYASSNDIFTVKHLEV